MSRESFPFSVDDISALAKALRGGLADAEGTPGHVEMLNILARAAGCRNFQHFRANAKAQTRLDAPAAPAVPAQPVDYARLRRLLRHFDAAGRLVRWPSKWSEQQVILWLLWSRLPARQIMTEKAVNACLEACHTFGDAALLRRMLCDGGLLARTPDCREYRRVEARPEATGRELIRRLGRVGEAGETPR
ncbi:DUF2087 domain-containing protein [Solidesulfovibrio carbinolicus]|uniref:DUF2087 domain-containing protein n=1 Tax=Solidesulfovibrio carbinolicus TaxID=296842 RepID=A0A4P6I1U4_9BACT|nr:DUF2087 domain-containing protein [Solidesulfovibrio carbinolicus]QAZ67769.1 hypothetical protein C3Y92_11275 [Solidesulfovibrio carbinolicus]